VHAAVTVILSSLQGIAQHLVCVCVPMTGAERERRHRSQARAEGSAGAHRSFYTHAAGQAQGTPSECRLASYAAFASLNTDTHAHMHSWTHRLTS